MPALIEAHVDGRRHAINPHIYGQFIEHLGRCITGGLYDEGSPLSDEHGFRGDVLDKVRGLRPPILRWPGGTYSKIYHWTDGIGPKARRPRRPNRIWGGEEDGHFGTDEFVRYCRLIGAEPFLCVNMATGAPEEAANWVEYCNGGGDTYYANLRRAHGFDQPHNVRFWGLGNEEYAEEDIGMLHTPERYTAATWEFAKYMKLTDPTIAFVVVGSATSPTWNEHVVRELGPVCDYLSLHYYALTPGAAYGDVFLRVGEFERIVESAEGIVAAAPARITAFPWSYRFPPRQGTIRLAIDEWNIWDPAEGTADDPLGLARPYNWRDALWVAAMLNVFHRHAATIGMAQLAQMVNILAPIVTTADASFRQTIYYPLALYRRLCGDQALHATVATPTFEPEGTGERIASLDVSATYRTDEGQVTLVVVNRDPVATIEAELRIEPARAPWILRATHELNAPSWRTANTLDQPGGVVTKTTTETAPLPVRRAFPAHSITALQCEAEDARGRTR